MKKSLILLLALVLTLLVSCTSTSTTQKSDYIQPFRVGSQGLTISFGNGLPPAKMYDTEDFSAMVQISNIGAATVGGPGDRIYLSGFDPRIIAGISSTGIQIPLMEGKSEYNPTQGTTDVVTFKGTLSRLIADRVTQPIMATACYAYETVATANLCVDPDPFSTGLKPKVCTPANLNLGTQGAPIAVSTVEVEPRYQKTGLRITVQNVGGGDAFRFGGNYLFKCSPYDPAGLQFDEMGYVQLTDVLVGEKTSVKASCKPLDADHIRLAGTTGQVYCEIATTAATAYVSPVSIVLRYGYRTQQVQNVEILKSGQ